MRKIYIIAVFFGSVLHARAQNEHPTPKADKLYRDGKFKEALPEYRKAAEENQNDAVIEYNFGDAQFRNAQYDEATGTFGKAFTGAADSAVRQRAVYNQGVAYSRQNKLEESVAAYKSALLMNPSDSDARVNLQKALTELKKKQQPDQSKDQNKKNQKQNRDNRPPPSKLNKKQVEQLLKALDQHEQEVQQKMMENKTRGVTKPDKDW